MTENHQNHQNQSSLEHMIPDYLKVENIIILIGMINVTWSRSLVVVCMASTCCVSSLSVSSSSLWTQLGSAVVSLRVSRHRCPVVVLQLVSVQTVTVGAVDAAVSQQRGWLAHWRSSGAWACQLSPVHARHLLQSIHHPAGELLQLSQAEVHCLQGGLHRVLPFIHLLQPHEHVLHPEQRWDWGHMTHVSAAVTVPGTLNPPTHHVSTVLVWI